MIPMQDHPAKVKGWVVRGGGAGQGYQFAPKRSRVVVVLSGVPQSCFSPFALMLPNLPKPRLTPPSSASLGDRNICPPPLAPSAIPDKERSACSPVTMLSTVVVRPRRPTQAPTYGSSLLRAIGKLSRAPASRWLRPKFPSSPATSTA